MRIISSSTVNVAHRRRHCTQHTVGAVIARAPLASLCTAQQSDDFSHGQCCTAAYRAAQRTCGQTMPLTREAKLFERKGETRHLAALTEWSMAAQLEGGMLHMRTTLRSSESAAATLGFQAGDGDMNSVMHRNSSCSCRTWATTPPRHASLLSRSTIRHAELVCRLPPAV